jgi:hypothetical protein
MADIATIREGLARNLESLRNVQVSAYMLASPTPPCLHIFPATIEYDRSMHRGLDLVNFTIEAFVAFGLDQGGQIRLDRMLAPTGLDSVKESVERDKTLGQMVQDVWVSRVSTYRTVQIPNQNDEALSATWLVTVHS